MRKIVSLARVGSLAMAVMLNSGCLAQHIIDSKERQEFARLNFEREKAGMRDLTWDEYHNHGMHSFPRNAHRCVDIARPNDVFWFIEKDCWP